MVNKSNINCLIDDEINLDLDNDNNNKYYCLIPYNITSNGIHTITISIFNIQIGKYFVFLQKIFETNNTIYLQTTNMIQVYGQNFVPSMKTIYCLFKNNILTQFYYINDNLLFCQISDVNHYYIEDVMNNVIKINMSSFINETIVINNNSNNSLQIINSNDNYSINNNTFNNVSLKINNYSLIFENIFISSKNDSIFINSDDLICIINDIIYYRAFWINSKFIQCWITSMSSIFLDIAISNNGGLLKSNYLNVTLTPISNDSNNNILPIIYNILPNFGPLSGGYSIYIFGKNLIYSKNCYFNNIKDDGFKIINDSAIICVVPKYENIQIIFIELGINYNQTTNYKNIKFIYSLTPIISEIEPFDIIGPLVNILKPMTISGTNFKLSSNLVFI